MNLQNKKDSSGQTKAETVLHCVRIGILSLALIATVAFSQNLPKLHAITNTDPINSSVAYKDYALSSQICNQAAKSVCQAYPWHPLNQFVYGSAAAQIYFVPENYFGEGSPTNALTDNNIIYLKVNQSFEYYVEELAHEGLHLGQYKKYGEIYNYNFLSPKEYGFDNMCVEAAANLMGAIALYDLCPSTRNTTITKDKAFSTIDLYNANINQICPSGATPTPAQRQQASQMFWLQAFGGTVGGYLYNSFPNDMKRFKMYGIYEASAGVYKTSPYYNSSKTTFLELEYETIRKTLYYGNQDMVRNILGNFDGYDEACQKYDIILKVFDQIHPDNSILYWDNYAKTYKNNILESMAVLKSSFTDTSTEETLLNQAIFERYGRYIAGLGN